VRAIYHILLDSSLAGPVNLVSPGPVTNREFTCALARTLNRPAFFRTPAWLLKAALGPMAKELLLASCRVKCARLKQTHFAFCHPELKGALEFLMGKQ